MILKIPCKIGETVETILIRRDAINVVQPIAGGTWTLIFVNGIFLPYEARVRFQLLASFLGRAHGSSEGAMDATKLKDNDTKSEAPVGQPDPLTGDRMLRTDPLHPQAKHAPTP